MWADRIDAMAAQFPEDGIVSIDHQPLHYWKNASTEVSEEEVTKPATDRLQIALDAGESVAPLALTEAHLPALVSAINDLGYTIMVDDETGDVRLEESGHLL